MRNESIPEALRAALIAATPQVREVRIETCPICSGDGLIEMGVDNFGMGHERACAYCAGTGRITVEVTNEG